LSDEKETILDPDGFITIKKKPSKEEIQKHYENFFVNYKDKKIRKNYQEKYDSKEIQHINLQNELDGKYMVQILANLGSKNLILN